MTNLTKTENVSFIDSCISKSHYSFYHTLLQGGLEDRQITNRATKLFITKLPNIVINIFLNPLNNKKFNEKELDKLNKIKSYTTELFQSWNGSTVLNHKKKIVVLLPHNQHSIKQLKESIKQCINGLIERFNFKHNKEQITIIAGVGQYYGEPSMVHLSYREANCAAQAYFLKGSQVVFFDELDEQSSTKDSLYLFNSEQKVLKSICIGDPDFAYKEIMKMLNRLGNLLSVDFSNNLFVFLFEQLVVLSRGVLAEGADPTTTSKVKRELTMELIHQTNNIEEMKQWVRKVVVSFISLLKEKDPTPSAQIVKDAEEFINNNYSYNISLDDVAREVHVSPAYLSRLFKEEKNELFVHYLMRIRLEQAKRLLSSTNLEIGIIASNVGFQNQNYFATAFRKKEGMTPSEFRNKLTNFKSLLK